jgi:hypothetical protein
MGHPAIAFHEARGDNCFSAVPTGRDLGTFEPSRRWKRRAIVGCPSGAGAEARLVSGALYGTAEAVPFHEPFDRIVRSIRKRKRPHSFLNVAFIYAGNDLLSRTLSRATSGQRDFWLL